MNLKSLGALISSLLEKVIAIMKKVIKFDTATGEKSYEDIEALPVGTVSQVMVHDGTNWVGSTNVKIAGTFVYSRVGGMSASLHTDSDKAVLQLYAERPLIDIVSTLNYSETAMEIRNNQGGTLTTKLKIDTYGVIKSANLAGTDTRPLVATADGTITVGTTPTIKHVVKTTTLTESEANSVGYNATDLGISSIDFTTNILTAECFVKLPSETIYKTVPMEFISKEPNFLLFSFINLIPINSIIKIYITYID